VGDPIFDPLAINLTLANRPSGDSASDRQPGHQQLTLPATSVAKLKLSYQYQPYAYGKNNLQTLTPSKIKGFWTALIDQ
jgi:hypothetical protein